MQVARVREIHGSVCRLAGRILEEVTEGNIDWQARTCLLTACSELGTAARQLTEAIAHQEWWELEEEWDGTSEEEELQKKELLGDDDETRRRAFVT